MVEKQEESSLHHAAAAVIHDLKRCQAEIQHVSERIEFETPTNGYAKYKKALDRTLNAIRHADSVIRSLDTAVRSLTIGSRSARVSEALTRSPLHLIWLDDDIDGYVGLISECANMGIEIVACRLTSEAFAALDQWSIDGIVLDLELDASDISGDEFLRILRESGNSEPVVVFSIHELGALAQRNLIELGASGFISKTEECDHFVEQLLGFFSSEISSKTKQRLHGKRLKDLIDVWDREKGGLSPDLRRSLETHLEALKRNMRDRDPDDDRRLLASLEAAQRIAENASGSLLASGLAAAIRALVV